MANHFSHAALPYPIRGARFTVALTYLDATGTPTDPTSPDTEISKDGGTYADCTEESTVIGGANGSGYITLTGAENDCSFWTLAGKGTGPKTSLVTGYPRILPPLVSGTAAAGGAGSLTLATGTMPISGLFVGCILKTTGGTGGGGTGGANNQARVITNYTSGRVASISPNWEVTPDNTTTYEVLLTETTYLRMADLAMILGDDLAITRLQRALNTEVLATVTTGATTTSIPTSSLVPTATATDQFKGRVLLFDRATTTTNLRGQGTKITASTAGGVLTVDALTTAPVSGDLGIIV